MALRPNDRLMEVDREVRKLLAELGCLLDAGAPKSFDPEKRGTTMPITTTKTVRELAVEVPHATRVFEKLGIDYCCGGSKSLDEACASLNLSVDEVLGRLAEADAASRSNGDQRDWSKAPLNELTAYIVQKHHGYVRSETPRLQALLAKVVGVHGQNHNELLRIQAAFEELAAELASHMFKEEQVLFPHLDRMQAAAEAGQAMPAPFFGTVRNPVQMMVMEHDGAGEKLREMREASNGYNLPQDACFSYGTLYKALEEFEKDLHQHIHLENNILFPRAIDMELRG